MNISAQDVINAIFHPDDTVCLRIFDDRKEGIFTGAKCPWRQENSLQ